MTRAADHGFITEAEVIEIWPMIPATDIRRARRKGDLPFYQVPGGPHYRRQDVETFIERKYRRGPTPAGKDDAPPQPGPAISPVFSGPFRPARPVSPRPEAYETMAAEEARIQGASRARQQPKEISPAVPVVDPLPEPETREQEIDRIRAEVFADRIMSRSPAARRAAEAAAAAKTAKAKGKGRRITPKPDRP